MADLLKTSIAAGASASDITGMTEGGQARVASNGKIDILQELDDAGGGTWQVVFSGVAIPAIVVGYVGTKLRITNIDSAAVKVRVNQL